MANPLNQIFPAYCAESLKTFLLKHAFTVETGMSSRIVRGLYAEVGFIPPSQKTYMTSCLLNSRQIVDSSLGCLLLHNVCYFAIAGILVQRRQADFKTISALLAVRRWGRQPRVAHTSSVHGR